MEKTLNKKDLINIFIRSNFLLGSFNFERMQAIARAAGVAVPCT